MMAGGKKSNRPERGAAGSLLVVDSFEMTESYDRHLSTVALRVAFIVRL